MPSAPPAPLVLAAFGRAGAQPVPLAGGQDTSWLAVGLVFKPVDLDQEELAWRARTYSQLSCDGFRLARPVAAADGSLWVDGWCATEYVAGQHEPRRWAQIIAVGERFHGALRAIPRPSFLESRASPWAVSDRVAWGEMLGSDFAQVRHLPQLTSALRPVSAPSQLIHGDLSGNVLFHDQLPPAIIDFSPYWRPTAYASAIVVADALVWEGADSQILDAVRHIKDFGQYLIRALIFRAVTDWILTRDEPAASGDPWAAAVDLACDLASNLLVLPLNLFIMILGLTRVDPDQVRRVALMRPSRHRDHPPSPQAAARPEDERPPADLTLPLRPG
jgi:uncharacterized protein (TIGR02569 family)